MDIEDNMVEKWFDSSICTTADVFSVETAVGTPRTKVTKTVKNSS